jgi:hypothetical protein
VSVYRIHFTWKEKQHTLKARELDMTHPYFVSMRGLIFPQANSVIIDPNGDELRKELGEAEHVMIPTQSVHLIEELSQTAESDSGKVIPFSGVEQSDDA